jgi:uncharacterized membrane protein YjjP (DUF1212 family)
MKNFNDLEDIEHLEKLDKEIKKSTRKFDFICLLLLLFFICSLIFGLTTFGWISLVLGIFSGFYSTNQLMNIHLINVEKITYIQIKENSEKLRNFMMENQKK